MRDLQYLYNRAKALNDDLSARRPDLKWQVRNGSLVLEDCPEWSRRRAAQAKREEEARRQAFKDREPFDREMF